MFHCEGGGFEYLFDSAQDMSGTRCGRALRQRWTARISACMCGDVMWTHSVTTPQVKCSSVDKASNNCEFFIYAIYLLPDCTRRVDLTLPSTSGKPMPTNDKSDNDSALMKIVQAIAISPEDARAVVEGYEKQLRSQKPNISAQQVQDQVVEKVVARYANMAAASGGATALAGVVPGIGTAVAMVGGGAADVSACLKLQVDMTMCLAMAINKGLSNEDAKHLSLMIALFGTLEQAASAGATRIASKAGVKLLNQYLKGPALITIKELFKRVGIQFAKTSAAKAIPFGVGVVIGSTANYALTRYVGRCAIECLHIKAQEDQESAEIQGTIHAGA